MKLVFIYYDTDGYTYGHDIPFCFEYESKEKFVFDVLEKAKDWKPIHSNYDRFIVWKSGGDTHHDDVSIELCRDEIDEIEKNVFTLEEWFAKEEITLIL